MVYSMSGSGYSTGYETPVYDSLVEAVLYESSRSAGGCPTGGKCRVCTGKCGRG